MINKLSLLFFACLISWKISYAQGKSKPDLYLYFIEDSSKHIFKTSVRLDVAAGENGPPKEYDIYNYSYKAGRKEYRLMLFRTLGDGKFSVRDSSILSQNNVLPYRDLERIKGLIADEWKPEKTPFNRVFVLERLSTNRFKVVEVQLYAPFASDGVRVIFH